MSISEIVSLIFAEFHPECKGTLSSLARTCKALQQPALDLLWHHQDGLIPLLKCMSNDLWYVTEIREKKKLVSHPSPNFE
jgi:hypothetical protein